MRLFGALLLGAAVWAWMPSPVSGAPVTVDARDIEGSLGTVGSGSSPADQRNGYTPYRGGQQVSASGTAVLRFDSSAPASFFAEVFRAPSGVPLTCTGCEDPLSAVPEPVSLLLFGTTLAGLGIIVRRRLRRPVVSSSA